MQYLSVSNYPIVIEPLVNIIEVDTALTGESPEAAARALHQPTRLYRIATEHVLRGIPQIAPGVAHFFGDSTVGDFEACSVMLGYNPGGLISLLITKHQKFGWEVYPLADEAVGRVTERPSCRIVFNSNDSCYAFIRLMRQVGHRQIGQAQLANVLGDVLQMYSMIVGTLNDG